MRKTSLFILGIEILISGIKLDCYCQTPLYEINVQENFKNYKTINLSKIGNKITYIPLETKSESIIQQIDKVDITKSHLIVSAGTKVLEFDLNGKFIRQIGLEGKGPQEYYGIQDFCIDKVKNEIFIISLVPSKLLCFNLDGSFKYASKLSFRPARIVIKDQKSLMFYLINDCGESNPSYIITDKKGNVFRSIPNPIKRLTIPGLSITRSPLYIYHNSVHFLEFGVDTLFYYDDKKLLPYAAFYLGKYKMDPDIKASPGMFRDLKSLKGCIKLSTIFETRQYLFIEFNLAVTTTVFNAVFDKTTKELIMLKDNSFVNDLDGTVEFWPHQITDDKTLIGYNDAFIFLKKIIPSNLRSKINETSNPVIILVE